MKLLLVDDEELTRNGLLNHIDWNSLGISEIRAASNGQQALELFPSFSPDILLTDIKMPHVSGIELARQIRRDGYLCKIIFISGYAEKEYLKSAIDLKVEAYIDKPVTPEAVKAVVSQTAAAIRMEQSARQRTRDLENHLNQMKSLMRDNIASLLIQKDQEYAQSCLMDISEFHWPQKGSFTCLCLEPIQSGIIVPDDCSLRFFWSQKRLFPLDDYYSGIQNHSRLFFLLHLKTPSCLQSPVLQQLLQQFAEEFGCTFRLVHGPVVKSLSQIRNSYQAACARLDAAAFYETSGELFFCKEEWEKNRIPDVLLAQKYTGSKECLAFIQELLSNQYTDIDRIRHKLYELYLVHTQKQLATCAYSWEEFQKMPLSRYQELFSCTQYKNETQDSLFFKEQSMDAKIHRALLYINKNYSNPQLSVRNLADHVDLSQNYFCTLFKENTHVTVNEYITRIRIERAKYLLRNTNCKLYEISDQIGIPDASYLNVLFKKFCGMTPTQYRNQEG